jgi:hypothetical protein
LGCHQVELCRQSVEAGIGRPGFNRAAKARAEGQYLHGRKRAFNYDVESEPKVHFTDWETDSVTDFAQQYRSMSEYQLAQLAADPNALVPEAREALRAELARRPPAGAGRSTQVEQQVSAKDPLDGVGGWLAWYCLGLFCGVYNEARGAVSLHGGVNSVMLVFSILCWGMAAWSLVTGVSLVMRARSALRIISIHLILGALQGLVFIAAGIALLASSSGAAGVAEELIGGGLAICVGYAIWFRYFQVSKRVKITFGRNL